MSEDESKYQTGEPRRPQEIESEAIISPDTRRADRLPPGQTRTRKWPVLQYGTVPIIPFDEWKLDIIGLVDNELSLSWEEFRALPRVKVYADFHCVTRWSRLDNLWEGVAVREILSRAGVQPEARYAIVAGYDGNWSTNLPLADFAAEDTLFADTHDGEPLSADHGGPVRLVVPRLYAWKSAKWVCGVALTRVDQPGYWENAGYHNHGDPWLEERR